MAGLAAAAALACGGVRQTADDEPNGWLTGRVQVTGSTPREQVIIEPDSGSPRVVTGDVRAELLRLSGALVRARGTDRQGRRFQVSDYEILEIAGGEPIVGTVADAGDGLMIQRESAGPVRLLDAPDELYAEIGSVVWVLVDSNGRVTGYGVIRQR